MKTRPGATWLHKRKLERIVERGKRRDARLKRKTDRQAEKQRQPGDKPSLYITIVAIALSLGTAVPSQIDWFLQVLAHGQWSHINAPRAIVAAVLVEVLCWLCAILYARSVRSTPVRIYRAGTFLFAAVAAAINYDHGHAIDPIVGLVFALASLMGVGAFELYMHRARHDARGLSMAEIRLRALRWRKHPLVMRETARIQATFGLAVPHEVAFRMAYLRKIGNPTIPIAVTSPRLADRAGDDAVPELPKRKRGASLGAEPTLELPVDWSVPDTVEELLGEAWPSPGAELGGTAVAAPERNPEPLRDGPKPAPSSGQASSAPASKKTSAPVPTGAVPGAGGERKPTRKGISGLVRKSSSSGSGSDRIQFAPTTAELGAEGTALDRIGRYLARAEAKGQSLDALDRKYIAGQFNVSDRQVRNSVKAYNAAKAEGK